MVLSFSVVQFLQGPLKVVSEEDGAVGIEPLEVSVNNVLDHFAIAREGHLKRGVTIHSHLDLLPPDGVVLEREPAIATGTQSVRTNGEVFPVTRGRRKSQVIDNGRGYTENLGQ